KRIEILEIQYQKLIAKKTLLGWLRFAAVVIIGFAIYFLLPYGIGYTLGVTILLLFVFTRLVFIDLENKTAIKHTQHLKKINEDELKALAHNYYEFEDGSQFMHAEHPYANDLDIFGRASL